MAIAKTNTLLSLDRYAKIMGINPVRFNGGDQINLASGATLFPIDNAQNDIWPQYSWQNFDQVSREDLALLIANSEQEITQYLGYYPAPVWIEKERHELNKHYRPELQSMKLTRDVTGNDTAIKTDFGKFIRGGRRKVEVIQLQADVTYWDSDTDGWDEFGTVVIPIPANVTDLGEIKVYFQGQTANPLYEIREFKSKAKSGNNLTIAFESWKLVDPSLYEELPTDNGTGSHIDMLDTASFVTHVDVYREYNDDTQDHVTFYAEDPTDASITEQGGFLYADAIDGIVMPVQAEYDATAGAWTRESSVCVYPSYVDLWYYSGMRNLMGKHPYSGDYLSNDFAIAIAYMATARLERVFYANNNATALASWLREPMDESVRGGNFKMPTPDTMTNPFGTRRGEVMAWRRIFRYFTPRRSGGAL